ncbi:HAD-IIIC family phosphatase [Amycolatopsis australiensis]|uniref:HAD-superfamily phosphatase, subfamily IIIC/FkbH-like domain-containing protein n=1 Tax=Amycolatopsis australiensis TaxID=546364 RepID=A0A1K1RKT2_9PSEU|nr:HAD-IIIC family phosphatase [Amycolatopsis australiensis]SFW72545.1 HAD-superfamily phosphatase, subfamily IIIC/FkbH-like domain-containing protein [Amycolatopsis australiensis]
MTSTVAQPGVAAPFGPHDAAELVAALRSTVDLGTWRRAVAELARHPGAFAPHLRRTLKIRVLATSTGDLLAELLPAAGLAAGLGLEVTQAPYGQLEQELLDPRSATCRERPDYVLLVPTTDDLALGELAGRAPDDVAGDAVRRWTRLHEAARGAGIGVCQFLFTPPAADPFGSAALRFPESPSAVVARVNAELRAGSDAVLVDCERLAAEHGLRDWRDDRFWFAARQAVSLAALPAVARATAAALAADQGLSRRCVVVDLDNTLWDGVVGEEGIDGVGLTASPRGEAFAAFQEHLLTLHRRGVALAVATKNDADLARRAIAGVPGMRLRPEHLAAVVADWRPKSEQLRELASRLSLGLDSFAFADDNPAERLEVRRALPQVDVIDLPANPSDYVAALAGRPTLEPGRLTAADRQRNASYAGLRAAAELRERTGSLEDFLDDLAMEGVVRPVDDALLPRVAQLLGKTNQFNLTTRRRSEQEVAALAADPRWICLALALRDRLADHGVVGVAFAELQGEEAVVDTLLLSCRVIGRTAERLLLGQLGRAAAARGCTTLVGCYRATDRNALVADLYPQLGFAPREAAAGEQRYSLPLAALDDLATRHIAGGESDERTVQR